MSVLHRHLQEVVYWMSLADRQPAHGVEHICALSNFTDKQTMRLLYSRCSSLRVAELQFELGSWFDSHVLARLLSGLKQPWEARRKDSVLLSRRWVTYPHVPLWKHGRTVDELKQQRGNEAKMQGMQMLWHSMGFQEDGDIIMTTYCVLLFLVQHLVRVLSV